MLSTTYTSLSGGKAQIRVPLGAARKLNGAVIWN